MCPSEMTLQMKSVVWISRHHTGCNYEWVRNYSSFIGADCNSRSGQTPKQKDGLECTGRPQQLINQTKKVGRANSSGGLFAPTCSKGLWVRCQWPPVHWVVRSIEDLLTVWHSGMVTSALALYPALARSIFRLLAGEIRVKIGSLTGSKFPTYKAAFDTTITRQLTAFL